jgi:hypothetical protein
MTHDPWEYCLLEKPDFAARNADDNAESSLEWKLTYYGATVFTDHVQGHAWDRAIAELGNDGWEMVSASDTVSDFSGGALLLVEKLYFKRLAGKPVYQPMLENF